MQTARRWGLWLAVLALSSVSGLVPSAVGGDQKNPQAAEGEKQPAAAKAAPKVGDAAPEFELKGIDGKTYRPADHKDKLVVLEWINQDCPYSNFKTGAGPKAKALSEKYKEKGVVWLAIDSTHYQTVEKNGEYAKQNKIPHPVLMDPDGTAGQAYGAKTTPHVFVIHKGKIVYAGAFDNDPRKDKPKEGYRGYVAEAIEAVLAGKQVPLASTDSWGCSVKYKPKK